MVVCKFYLKGNCKFGDRCYNEHIRNDSYDSGRNRGQQHRQGNRRYDDQQYDNQQNYSSSQSYIKPSSFHNDRNRQVDSYSSPFSRRNQNESSFGSNHGYKKDNFSRGNQNDSSFGSNQGYNKDRFSWKRESNRFDTLGGGGDPGMGDSSTEDQLIITSIQEDIKTWGNTRMWLYSCYSCTKIPKCVEGLPDIQPEELRTLFYLHGENAYSGIMQEVQAMYARRKDELMSMTTETKMSLLSNLRSHEDGNPSSCLTIMPMYGAGMDFKALQTASTSTLVQSEPTATSLPTPPAPPQINTSLPPTGNIADASIKPSLFKPDGGAGVQPSPQTSSVYTDKSLLTQNEVDQFEATSFTLGKIPMRPPPREYCR